MSRRRLLPGLLFALALLALTLLAYHRLAFSDWIMARGDTFSYHYPYWQIRAEAFRAGRLPLWTPDLFMGAPLLANPQIGAFYPPNWLVAPLDPPDAVRVSAIGHVFWAALGAYLLARRALGVSRPAALIGAVGFALGGHLGAHVEQINQLQGLAWLPWLLLLFDAALRTERTAPGASLADTPLRVPTTGLGRGRRAGVWVLLLAMAWALQIFSGHTQTVFISGVALGLYALCTRPVRGLLILAAAGVVAALLALPQLIPTLELSSLSNRSGGFNVNQATAFSFSPFVTGRGLLPSYDRMIFSEYIAYPGILMLALAWVGVVVNPHRLGDHAGTPPQGREKGPRG